MKIIQIVEMDQNNKFYQVKKMFFNYNKILMIKINLQVQRMIKINLKCIEIFNSKKIKEYKEINQLKNKQRLREVGKNQSN